MADEHHKWLDRGTAERLLRGESLEAVDASVLDQAKRLEGALGALSAQAAAAPGELPGEQAALAAFRKAREAAAAGDAAAGPAPGGSGRRFGRSASGADADPFRTGAPVRSGIRSRAARRFHRPAWGRPARLALAAVVAASALGGVAAAVGSGVLPLPFVGRDPAPAASTPGRPLASPYSPGGPGTSGGAPSDEAAGPGRKTGPDAAPGAGDPSGGPGAGRQDAAAACRDLRGGKPLGTGRERALENLAGGAARVDQYCRAVLSAAGRSASAASPSAGSSAASGGAGNGTGQNGGGNGNGGNQNGNGQSKGNNGNGRTNSGGDNGNGGSDSAAEGAGQGDGAADGGKNPGGGHAPRRGTASPAPSAPGRPAATPAPGPGSSHSPLRAPRPAPDASL